jgi:hypothetical protein
VRATDWAVTLRVLPLVLLELLSLAALVASTATQSVTRTDVDPTLAALLAPAMRSLAV